VPIFHVKVPSLFKVSFIWLEALSQLPLIPSLSTCLAS